MDTLTIPVLDPALVRPRGRYDGAGGQHPPCCAGAHGRSPRRAARSGIYAKAEWFNPSGSVKDRAALVHDPRCRAAGSCSGRARPSWTPPRATPASRMPCSARRWAIRGDLSSPQNASPERKQLLRAYGADGRRDPGPLGTDGAILEAAPLRRRARPVLLPRPVQQPRQLAGALPRHRPRNLAADRRAVTHFVAGSGTGGTFVGTTRRSRS